DEQQDSSRLQNEAIRRLTSNSRWVYICGDVFQSIYGFSGSDPRMMMQWDVGDRQRILPQSYRCPAAIQALGEEILSDCSDYWDRKIKPAEHEGEVDVIDYVSREWIDELNPNQSTLL